MNQKHFDAILAKNDIARELRELWKWENVITNSGGVIHFEYIKSLLKDIEAYIGEGNQPSAEDIITCKEYNL
jgi:hypothetical protein